MPTLDKKAILRDRAHMLHQSRDFFYKRNLIEVDCPILSSYAAVDAHIDLITTNDEVYPRYLHSSPEYGMKRLLVDGLGDIYQLAHVFRKEEQGSRHNPEFMMAEWYRLGFSFDDMIEETTDYVRLFIGDIPSHIISYRDLFKEYAGIDYLQASEQDLIKVLQEHDHTLHATWAEGKEVLLNLLLGLIIEPQLGKEHLTILAYYPASQAALAKTRWHGDERVAERFEIYYQGIELANGYHELSDPQEQRKRFIEANQARLLLGKEALPIDEHLLKALEKGLPECCGVAVGFDRLMMLRHQATEIRDVIPFAWDEA
jgi:elongation factor P--(R)-beta-lysine ligase